MSSSKFRKRRQRKNKSNSKKIILIVALLAVAVTIIVGYNMLGNNTSNENNPEEITSMKVLLETSMGNITIQLRDNMPITTENFKNLVQQGVYDSTIFHRVMSDFMIQGGDPNGNGMSDDGIPTIPDEFMDNNNNNRGTIAMANAGANTGSSQFFINVINNNYLDDAHPVFGEVISGMDVVDAISNVETDTNDRPIGAVTIIRAQLID